MQYGRLVSLIVSAASLIVLSVSLPGADIVAMESFAVKYTQGANRRQATDFHMELVSDAAITYQSAKISADRGSTNLFKDNPPSMKTGDMTMDLMLDWMFPNALPTGTMVTGS